MAIDAPMPPVFEVAARFNDAVVGREAKAAAQMAKIYVGLHGELQGLISTLLSTLSDNPTRGEITRLWRSLGLESQVLAGLQSFGDDAASIITQGQAQSIQTAMRDARRLVDIGLPPGIDVSVLEASGVGWNQLPESSLINMLGRLGDGSPLTDLPAELGLTVNRQVRAALVEGVGLGLGPREVALRTRNAFGGGLTRALRVSRTEILRSYREGNRMQWQANPRIVRQWERRAAWDERTCPACLALDGTRYRIEDPGDFHVNDRCAMVPIPVSYRDLGLDVDDPSMERPTARDWFGEQSSGTQREMLGAAKFDAWESGAIDFSDMVQHTTHPDWGRSATVATLGQMGLVAAPAETSWTRGPQDVTAASSLFELTDAHRRAIKGFSPTDFDSGVKRWISGKGSSAIHESADFALKTGKVTVSSFPGTTANDGAVGVNLMHKINMSQRTHSKLYRGMRGQPGIAGEFVEGEVVDLGLASFSKSKPLANTFGKPWVDRGINEPEGIVITLEDGKGYDIKEAGHYSDPELEKFEKEVEVISGGRVRVVKVTKNAPETREALQSNTAGRELTDDQDVYEVTVRQVSDG